MTKRGIWPVRAMYTLVAVALVISLMITAAPPSTVLADAHDVTAEWDGVTTPSMDGWKLAPQSVIVDFATASPGQVAYAIVETGIRPDTTPKDWAPWYLLKSTDHAATWSDITEGVNTEVRKITNTPTNTPTPPYELVKVACAPDDTNYVAVVLFIDHASVDDTSVFVSIDGGTSFRSIGSISDLNSPDDVYDFAISPAVSDVRDIAVAGWGGIWRSQATGALATAWADAHDYLGWFNHGGDFEAVVAVHFPPSWASDWTILIVSVSEYDAYLQSGIWGDDGDGSWNLEANFKAAVKLEDTLRFAVPDEILYDVLRGATASITTPSDYAGRHANRRYAWVHLNYAVASGNGTVAEGKIFRVRDGSATAVIQQIPGSPWLTNVHYVGTIASGKAIAGLLGDGFGDYTEPCQGVQVYRNDDIADMEICCLGWFESCKPPTGSMGMAAFYVTPDKAYAVAVGGIPWYDESAWSFSFDGADTWNQLSLIDTHISFLSDVAVSPDCNKTMLASVNLGPYGEFLYEGHHENSWFCDSVWYHAGTQAYAPEYSGKWLRTWSGQFEGFQIAPFYNEFSALMYGILDGLIGPTSYFKRGLLRLNPAETNAQTVYLYDYGNDKIYYNGQQTLACWEPGRAKVSEIVDLAVKNESTIYALGREGKVTVSNDYGVYASFTTPVETELDYGRTIALWGDEILVGGQSGDVAHSPHGTGNFTMLENGLPDGLVSVAFDSYYGANDTIYAAVGDFDDWTGGIFMWVIGESTRWSDTGAESYAYTGIVLDSADGNPKTSPATGGVLYASYLGERDVKVGDTWYEYETGVARSLTPIVEVECADCPAEWDYLVVGLTEYDLFVMGPQALKICGCLTADSYTRLFAIGIDRDALWDNIWDPPVWGWGAYDMEKGEWGSVWRFIDCYSKVGVDLRNPASGITVPADACDCLNAPFTASWDRVCDACYYQIQFAMDANFENLVELPDYDRVLGSPAASPSKFIGQHFLPGETYYWRVRAVEAGTFQEIRSWWSEPRKFTVAPALGTGVYLVAPGIDATGQPRTNIAFVWDSVAVFDSYNFVLSRNADMSSPEATATGLTTKAYTYTGANLAYDTPYYWRVTAIKDGAPASVAIGTFRTMAEPEEVPPPPPVTTPFWVWVIIAIGAVLVIVVIVLIFRTRRV